MKKFTKGMLMFFAVLVVSCIAIFFIWKATGQHSTTTGFSINKTEYDKQEKLFLKDFTTFENRYYQNDDASDLSWGESYILQSMLEYYELTGNKSWLDKFITHNDMVYNNRFDYRGIKLWLTPVYSTNIMPSTYFETDADTFKYWTRQFGTQNDIFIENGSGFIGQGYGYYYSKNALRINSVSSGVSGVTTTFSPNYTPGFRYTLNLNYRTTANTKVNVKFFDNTANALIMEKTFDSYTSGTKYKTIGIHEFMFNMPSQAGHILTLTISHTDTVLGKTIWVDGASWANRKGGITKWEEERLVGPAQITYPSSYFMNIVKRENLQGIYKQKADYYAQYLTKEIFPYYENSIIVWDKYGSYSERMWDAAGGPVQNYSLGINRMAIYARVLLNLYDYTGDQKYLNRAVQVGWFVKDYCLNYNVLKDSYDWPYWCSSEQWFEKGRTESKGGDDNDHAQLTFELMIDLYKHGKVFTESDMKRLANTVVNNQWNGKYNTPVLTSNWSNAPGLCIAAHVDGKDTQCNTYLTFHGASRLAEFDSRIYTIADTFLTLGTSQRSAYARLKLMEFYKRGG